MHASKTPASTTYSAVPLRLRDRPRLEKGELEFRQPAGVLFGELPKHTDARQGFIGDCYLLSALSALARSNPHALKSMFTDHGDSSFTVRFHRRLGEGRFAPEEVRVDSTVPVRASDGLPIYARSEPQADGRPEIWPLVAEKAYAAWKTGYHVSGEGGLVEQTLEELTGQPTRMLFVAESHPEKLWALLSRATQEGWPTTVCTYGRNERPGIDELGFHPNHIVIFLGVHTWMGRRLVWLRDPFDVPATGKLVLPDPRGVYTIPWQDFLNYFAEVHLNAAAAQSVQLPPYPRRTLIDVLESSYVFHDLPRAELRALAKQFRRMTFEAGQVIHRAGDASDAVDLLEYGNAAIDLARKGKKPQRLGIGRAGGMFGEVHGLKGIPYAASFTALNDLALYRLPTVKLREWCDRFPVLRERIFRRFDVQLSMLEWSRRPVTTLTVDSLLRASTHLQVGKGQTIYREGEVADALYVVVSGAVELQARGKGGALRRLARVEPGGIFGEGELVRHTVRKGTARATRKTELLRVDLATASETLEHFDVVQRQLDAIIGRRDAARRGLRRHR